MKIRTWIKYMEEYYPPKCRKPRFEEKETYEDIELQEVKKSEVKLLYKVETELYYSYNGVLYRKACSSNISNFKIEDPLENLKYCHENCSTYFGFEPYCTLIEMKTRAYKDLKKYLLIDGILYTKANTPMYEINTFGMGNNHGSTSLSVSETHTPHEYNFYANERNLAISKAIEIAKKRGDTDSLNRIRECKKIIEY